MNFYAAIKKIAIITLCIITSSCINKPVTHQIKFINNTNSEFKCYCYTNQLLSISFVITLGKKSSKGGSIGEAGVSDNTSWACKPFNKHGFINYSLKTKINQNNPAMLTVSISPLKKTVQSNSN